MKYIKIFNTNIPVIITDGDKVLYNNALVDVTPEIASALGYKPLVDNPPETEATQVVRLTGYHEDGANMVADYTVVDLNEATAQELKAVLAKFDTTNMNNYTKTELLQLLAKLGRK